MNSNKSIDFRSPYLSLSKYLDSQPSKLLAGLVIGLGVAFNALPANALSYVTTINYTTPVTVGSDTVGSIRLDWSTNVGSGTITESNLTDWSISLIRTNGSTLYTDSVIVGGLVKPIGGQARAITDIDFGFDFGTNFLNPFDNDKNSVQVSGTGITYRVFTAGSPPLPFIIKYDNTGIPGEDPGGANQDTQPIPFEFSPTLGLLLLGIGYGIKKRIK